MPLELRFVSAEEAAKWPEGCQVLAAKCGDNGPNLPPVDYSLTEYWFDNASLKRLAKCGYDRFARLPDALPDLKEPA